jgi:hypothetical protein
VVHACIVSVQSQLILLLCYSMKYTVCWNNVVIVSSNFLAGSIWRWQNLCSRVWKWLLSSLCVCLPQEIFTGNLLLNVNLRNSELTCSSVIDLIPNSGDKTGSHSTHTNQIYIYRLQNWQFTRGDLTTLELRPSITCRPMWRIFSRLGNNSNEPWRSSYTSIHFIA